MDPPPQKKQTKRNKTEKTKNKQTMNWSVDHYHHISITGYYWTCASRHVNQFVTGLAAKSIFFLNSIKPQTPKEEIMMMINSLSPILSLSFPASDLFITTFGNVLNTSYSNR